MRKFCDGLFLVRVRMPELGMHLGALRVLKTMSTPCTSVTLSVTLVSVFSDGVRTTAYADSPVFLTAYETIVMNACNQAVS